MANKKAARTSEIRFTVQLDENNIPLEIDWYTSDNETQGKCGAMFLGLWDEQEENTLRIDLWRKDFTIDDMKKFFHQNLLTMADSFQRATGEDAIMEDLRDYCAHFAEKMHLHPDNGQGEQSNEGS